VRRILIVDDEPAVRVVIATVLGDERYGVQMAPDGRVALDVIASAPPDLLITDVMMPHVDGWAVLAHVREQNPALPVILMSAVDPRIAPRSSPDPDHTDFLAKPFTIEALLAVVRRRLGLQPD
jgi:CheY-like chemotaxis protein